MGKYRKKPIVIEAIQWDGTYLAMVAIKQKFPKLQSVGHKYHPEDNTVDFWDIGTLEGSYRVSPGDYIIKGIVNEFYPCKEAIFEKTYEKVED